MPVDPGYMEYVMEMLQPLGDVKSRSMFDGYGVFESGDMFALVSNDTLYFKADDSNRSRYEDAGSAQFKPMPYWELPAEVLDSEAEVEEWARLSIELAHAGPKKKRRTKRRTRQNP